MPSAYAPNTYPLRAEWAKIDFEDEICRPHTRRTRARLTVGPCLATLRQTGSEALQLKRILRVTPTNRAVKIDGAGIGVYNGLRFHRWKLAPYQLNNDRKCTGNPLTNETRIKGFYNMESLILAQDKRWRRALCMQVERILPFGEGLVANG